MENKWKVAGQQPSGDAEISGNIAFAEETATPNFSAEDALAEVQAAASKNPILQAETKKKSSLGSRFTQQKRMAVTMGAVGLGLFMIGLAPFFIDSAAPNGLKGNLTQDSAAMDPLAAMFQNASAPAAVETANTSSTSGSSLSNFGDSVAGVSANTNSATTTVVASPSPSTVGLASFEKSTYEALREDQASSSEIDRLLAGNTTFTPTPVVENTNIGKSDITGEAFGGPNEPLHASAGLQNTSVAPPTAAAKVIKETPKSGMSENIALGLALMIGSFYWSRRRTHR